MRHDKCRSTKDESEKDTIMKKETNDANNAGTRVLIVYYSHSGNTRELANRIHKRVGGDILEIQPVDSYPDDYETVTKQAKRELQSGYKPALKTRIENIGSYDVVFLGSPNWWNTIAPPVITFLTTYDLSGKTAAPFITHGGGGVGRAVADIAALCPNSTISDGLAVWGREAKAEQNKISEWLRKFGLEDSKPQCGLERITA